MSDKKKTTTSTTTKNTTKKSSSWSLNKISFYSIGAVAILYLIATILGLCGLSLKVISALQGIATAIIICIVSILAWKYVSVRSSVWKMLYVVFLLIVLIGVLIPLVF